MMAEQFIRDSQEIFDVPVGTVNFNSAMENLIESREHHCNIQMHGNAAGKKNE